MPQQKINFINQFTPTGVDQTAGNSLRALAGLSDQVGGLAFQQASRTRQKEGRIEGAKAGLEAAKEGKPITAEEDGLFNIYDAAYNQSMRAGYLSEVDNDNREKLTQLSSEYAEDHSGFIANAEAYKKGVLNGLDEETALAMEVSLNKQISSASTIVREKEKAKNLREADESSRLGITNNLNDALSSAFDGDYISAAEGLTTVKALLDSRLKSGKISITEHDNQTRAIVDAVDVEANRHQFGQLLDINSVSKSIEFLQKVSDNKIKGKTPEQHRNLLNILQQDMNKHFQLQDKAESGKAEAVKGLQSNNSEKLFIDLVEGDLSASRVIMAMQSDDISTEQGKQLIEKINSRGQGVDDHGLILEINDLVKENPKEAKKLIAENMGTNLTENTAVSLNNLSNVAADEIGQQGEPILTSSKTKRFKKFLMDTVKVQNQFGFIDPEKQKLAAKLSLTFDQRVLEGEDPALAAKELIDVDEAFDLPNPRFGTNDEPIESQKELDAFFIEQAGKLDSERVMSEDDYNRETENLTKAQEIKQSITNFQKAYEAALNEQ